MITVLEAIYRTSGLGQLGSAYLAVSVLFFVVGALIYALAKASVYSRTRLSTNALLNAVTILIVLAFGVVSLLAVSLGLLIRAKSGMVEDAWFSTYGIILFVIANLPFWLVYWRAGLFKEGSAPNSTFESGRAKSGAPAQRER